MSPSTRKRGSFGPGGARIGRGRGVADQGRVVAALAQLVAEVGEARVERNGVLHCAMIHLVEAGQQAGARRTAGCGLCEMIAEGHALLAEPIDVRHLEVVRPELGQHQAAPLVDDDQKDVLGRRHADSPWLEDCAMSALKSAEETTRGAFQDRDDRAGQHRPFPGNGDLGPHRRGDRRGGRRRRRADQGRAPTPTRSTPRAGRASPPR